MKGRAAVALAALALCAPALAGAQQATPLPDADTVIAHIQSYWKNIDTYQVPVTINGNVKVSFISVPFSMDGTEYYKAPDREALHMNNVPSMAKGFENTMANMGTPQTWSRDFAISVTGVQQHAKHTAYVLVGTPRRESNVSNVTMLVNQKTYAIEAVKFNYKNGATLDIELTHHGLSPYHLPTSATLSAKFPQYSGGATISYGSYKLNQPIPDSVFQKQ